MAGKSSKAEKKAAKIWSLVKARLDRGQELQACKQAVKMAPFAETKAYAKAKKALLAKGISIEDPLMSWTAKAMVRAQNMVERDLQTKGDMSHIGTLPDHPDAWGSPLRVEMVEMGEYLYIVRSAGPDREFMTDDDPLIGGLKPKGMKTKPKAGTGSGQGTGSIGPSQPKKAVKTNSTLKSLLGRDDAGGAGKTQGDQSEAEYGDEDESTPKEEVVELEDLIEKSE